MTTDPARKPPRTVLAVRISPAGLDTIDALAAESNVPRAEYVRTLIGEALRSETVRTAVRNRLRATL